MFFQWQDHHPVTLICIDKYYETNDAVSIKLADLSESLLFEFKAGQFITLGVDIDGKTEFRAYSLCSQSGDDHLQLTIKRVEGGKVSNFILDKLMVGDTLQVLPPKGDFNCIDHPPCVHQGQKKALLISAGCGITPVMAMAKQWLNSDELVDIEFLHIARSQQETIYFDLIETYHAAYDHFHLRLLLKNREATDYPEGRLNAVWLQQLVPDFKQRTIYLCGPNQFMQDVRRYFTDLDFDMRHFFQESFTPTQQTQQEVSSEQVMVQVPDLATSIEANKGDLLADVLENAGLPLIVACRSGICGSCKCKVSQGAVTSTSQETLTEQELEQGYVLACSSSLESDVKVQLG
ncbi:hybrid-cluster NAD(P)-dependent oxidoreductase [Vibrio pacinii]|uniref:hybrid-cluster NAD(P)-dependent oxidoreductase n=1 Tax=Vibrio pacinii TaxID=170674 RepID=UPI00056F3B96|nr:hybrid-cluster NAD(P)-dependent oxidoreductase [Vibrio pacinii]